MIDPIVWTEGIPDNVARRAREATARNKAAVAAKDANPDCPVAQAGLTAARIESEWCKALLGEWCVDQEVSA